jgi:hypothetical protein
MNLWQIFYEDRSVIQRKLLQQNYTLLEVTTVKCLTVEAWADQIVKECYILTNNPAYFMHLEVTTVKCLTVDASANQEKN